MNSLGALYLFPETPYLDSDVGVQKRETSGDNRHELTELLETLLSIM
jgi:hypothetical protein